MQSQPKARIERPRPRLKSYRPPRGHRWDPPFIAVVTPPPVQQDAPYAPLRPRARMVAARRGRFLLVPNAATVPTPVARQHTLRPAPVRRARRVDPPFVVVVPPVTPAVPLAVLRARLKVAGVRRAKVLPVPAESFTVQVLTAQTQRGPTRVRVAARRGHRADPPWTQQAAPVAHVYPLGVIRARVKPAALVRGSFIDWPIYQAAQPPPPPAPTGLVEGPGGHSGSEGPGGQQSASAGTGGHSNDTFGAGSHTGADPEDGITGGDGKGGVSGLGG